MASDTMAKIHKAFKAEAYRRRHNQERAERARYYAGVRIGQIVPRNTIAIINGQVFTS